MLLALHSLHCCSFSSHCTVVLSLFIALLFSLFSALKPTDVFAFFKEVSDQANDIQDAYNKCKEAMAKMPVPSVTVFLDEVNTASCLGLFKEIIVDRTIDGVVS